MEAVVKKHHKKMKSGDVAFSVINYLVFIIITLICVYPFYYMIINTISSNELSANGVINFLPKGIHLATKIKIAAKT